MPSRFATGYRRSRSQLSGSMGLSSGLRPRAPMAENMSAFSSVVPHLSTPFVDGPGHCFRNCNPPVIGAPVAVLAFDLFRLKFSCPSRVHDIKRRALVRTPSQSEDFAGVERTERGDEEEGAVAGR